jgi:hypothetical protein
MNRQLATLVVLGLLFLHGCGGGGSTPPPPPVISVSFSTAPPASVGLNALAPIVVTVTNDSANAGVIFSCVPTGACGTFAAITPTSATYNSPATMPSGGSVTIKATSVTDTTKLAQATVTISSGITVTMSTTPPATLSTAGPNSTAAIATTTNDAAGVTWSCTPASACGSFNPTSTLSTVATTYTAPSTIPVGATVTITATSVTDTTKLAQASVTITTGSAITVVISTPPPATLSNSSPNNTATIVATTNDTAGVTWSCTPASTCGSFNPTSTLSTVVTTYTAPSTVPAGATVTITATSVTDTTKLAQASVTITGMVTLATLNGHYVFLVHSPTGNRSIATWIGSVTLDGAGNVTGGIEEIASNLYIGDVADPILATGAPNSLSGYTVDPSGHGRLTMSTVAGEVLRISFVLSSATHAEVIEADGSPSEGNPGTGTLDLQTPANGVFAASQISGTYSFTMVGIDDATSSPLSFGGSFTSDGNSHITGGAMDINSGASQIETDSIGMSTFDSPPDANGRGLFHFAVANPGKSRRFVYYILAPKVLRLIEVDGLADMGGSAYLQPTTAPSLSGSFAYQHSGWTSTTSRAVAAGQFSLASNGSISAGICDSNPGGGAAPSAAAAVSGSYSAPTLTLTESAATSTLKVYPVDSSINILDPDNSTGGGGALLLHTDSSINGTGILLPQQTPQPIAGNYAVNLMNSIAATPAEVDLVGLLTGGTSGLADYEQNDPTGSNPMLGAALSASLSADASHAGRYTGTVTVNPASTAISPYPFIPGTTPPTTFNVSLYQANGSQAFIVETDNKANAVGRTLQQTLP